jgi:predicted dehydrogenase
MKPTKLRFAICGAGSFGPELAPYIQEVAEVVAVCEPDPTRRARFRERTGLAVMEYGDYEKMLEDSGIDAVAVTSTNNTHRPITVEAARAGKHVFCEKAMANTVSDCWEMVRACRAAGVKLMVGHKRRLRAPWARMIELRERLGPVVGMVASLYYNARPYDHQGWWTREADCGGLLDIAGVHTIDWMRAMAGDVAAVRAVRGPQIDPRYDFPDTMHTTLEFRSGAVADLNVSLAYPLQKFRESVGPQAVCERGGMRLAAYLDHIDLYWQHQSDAEQTHERFDDLGFRGAYRKEIADFVRWIQEDRPPCLTWVEGLRCVEVMEAAHRSTREGGSILRMPLYPELEDSQASAA